MPLCSPTSLSHALPGRWVARNANAPPYYLNKTVWSELDLWLIAKAESHSPHNYGICEAAARHHKRKRNLYNWQPHECSIPPLATDACSGAAFSSPKTFLLFVGDSTVAQLWLSFCLLLGAKLGVNSRKGSEISKLSRVSASACGDRVRLSYVRSDLLLLDPDVAISVHACLVGSGHMALSFAGQAARQADVVVLGVGQHFANLYEWMGNRWKAPFQHLEHRAVRVIRVTCTTNNRLALLHLHTAYCHRAIGELLSNRAAHSHMPLCIFHVPASTPSLYSALAAALTTATNHTLLLLLHSRSRRSVSALDAAPTPHSRRTTSSCEISTTHSSTCDLAPPLSSLGLPSPCRAAIAS